MPNLQGKTALVTGAARGIGASIAAELASQGAHVMLVDLLDAESTAADIAEAHPGVRALAASVDVRDEAQVRDCVQRTVAEFGRLDILVNNAGTCGRWGVDEVTPEMWGRDLDTNAGGTFWFCKHALHPHMIKAGTGAIINISSISGIMGGPSAQSETGRRSGPAYAASKGAVIALTKWLAKEYGESGIRVNSVAPGPIATPMTDNLDYSFDAQFLKHMGKPEDIARGVAYLASADYVTGQVLKICGGSAVG